MYTYLEIQEFLKVAERLVADALAVSLDEGTWVVGRYQHREHRLNAGHGLVNNAAVGRLQGLWLRRGPGACRRGSGKVRPFE